MKRRLYVNIAKAALLIAAVFLIALQPLESYGYEPAEFIKVGLKHGATAAKQCEISSASGFMLGSVSERNGFQEALPLPGHKVLIASVSYGHVELKDKSGVLISSDIGKDGCLLPYDQDKGYISVDGQTYRGGIMLKADGDSKLTVINYLDMEEYLYGVVHREIGMSSPIEALKAQAITARTYAALNKNRHSSLGFDVCAGTHCQVYGGCKDEYESTNRAVDETAGLMIYCGNKPVDTYYYKNSGGHTQNSEEVWNEAAAHLKGKSDPYCPEYSWKAVIGFDTLRQKLIQADMDPGKIMSVRIGGRNSAGAVAFLIVSGENRDIIMEKTKIRDVLGPSLVRSTHFSIGEFYVKIDQDTEEIILSLIASDNKGAASVNEQVYLISGKGISEKKDILSLSVIGSKNIVKVESLVDAWKKEEFRQEDTAKGPSLILSGLGYGHGVGMAQDGAIEMAKMGMTYMDILKFYYTGIEVY